MPIAPLLDIMARLRDKNTGCPWDIEQTFDSIAPHTIEEAYEVADAIARQDIPGLKEELGDLLLQTVFHSQMAKEEGLFTFEDVVTTLTTKLVSRHPHVFGETEVKTAADQEELWEKLKAEERKEKQGATPESALDNITLGLPGLTRAVKLQKRAAKVGFDWKQAIDVLDKLEEETAELKEALTQNLGPDALKEELGDLLFVLANLGRKLNIDPEEAIRGCNSKFERRFRAMETFAREQGKDFSNLSLDAQEELWQHAKKKEKK